MPPDDLEKLPARAAKQLKIVTRYGSCEARPEGNGCRFPEQVAHGVRDQLG